MERGNGRWAALPRDLPDPCALRLRRVPRALLLAPEPEPLPVATPAQLPAQSPAAVPASGPRPAPAHVAAKPAPADTPAPSVPVNYKESGSPNAPIVCELYTDYQCPHCATAYDQIIPMLRAEYVLTGKVRFVHRDFPLPSHQYARLAARFANAAGTLGQYELVVTQIFRTQAIWAQSGDVDSQVALVLTPGLMDQVRASSAAAPISTTPSPPTSPSCRQDNLNQTPTLVVTYKGNRQLLAHPFPLTAC